MKKLLCVGLLIVGAAWGRADVMDDFAALQSRWDDAFLDLYGGRLTAAEWNGTVAEFRHFAGNCATPEAQALASEPAPTDLAPVATARWAGAQQARLQHMLALEMLDRQSHGDRDAARQWRALIRLPKYADAVQGALTLKENQESQRGAVSQLLAREYLIWQTTLLREKVDALAHYLALPEIAPELVAARSAEIEALAAFPPKLVALAQHEHGLTAGPAPAALGELIATAESGDRPRLAAQFADWQGAITRSLPNLLSADEVTRRERFLLKLLRLIPIEYSAGVRDGAVVVPMEYREASAFTTQAQQMLEELDAPWRTSKAAAMSSHGPALQQALADLEQAIAGKRDKRDVEQLVKAAAGVLEDGFDISLRRQGKASDVVAETVLDIRTLLKDSLRAAQSRQWAEAERLRLEAYTNFDLEIETRVLPRAPQLSLRTERLFLDGDQRQRGLKSTLDARATGEPLTAAYQATLDSVQKCAAMLQVGLSPTTAVLTTMTVVTREGLEAVVILAALLAGLRGAEQRKTRRCIGLGAWLAIAAAGVTFALSRWVITSLSRYGEKLESVVSILAVAILLVVTNWVFHKMYWADWNAKLRKLSKTAQAKTGDTGWAPLAMIGVGFLTIYREGFETVLFLQSLILEGGLRHVLLGLLLGGAIIGAIGVAVFWVGAHLPYRKMLVFTGVLVVSILVTFIGSTVRLWQTVGWLPIHPITGLEFPTWMGVWLGIYPSWEGLLLPPLGLVYVGGAWLYVKWRSRQARAQVPVGAAPAKPRRRELELSRR